MTLTVAQVKTEIEQLFDELQAQILSQIGQSLPLIGPLALPIGAALFAALESAIDTALNEIPDDPMAELIDQIALALDDLDYVQAARVGDDLAITLTYDDPALVLDPEPFLLDVGLPGLGLEVDGTFAASLTPKLDISLSLDGEGDDAGELTIVDGTDALSIDLVVDIDVEAEAELGFLDLTLSDNDAATPEIDINFTVDLPAGNPGDVPDGIEADLTGAIEIDWSMIAAGVSFLPDVYADLKISYPLTGPITAAIPTIAFEDVEVDFGSYVRVISETLGELAGIFNAAPFGQLFDALTAPIPGIQDVLEEIGWVDEFDVVGDDGVVSIVDLACLMSPDLIPQVEPFYKALLFINTVRKLNEGDGGGSVLKLGDITLLGAATSGAIAGPSALTPQAASQVLGPLGALFTPTPGPTPIQQADDIVSAGGNPIADTLRSLNNTLSANTGLSLPLLNDPSKIMDLLFNVSGSPVDLVTYDVPKIEVSAQYEQYIPLIGPIGLVFGGGIFGSIDIDVGFDTRGFQSGNLAEGLFFNTPALASSPTGFAPAGTLGTFIFAGGGINAVLVSAYAKAELGFFLNAYLDANVDGKLYLTDLGESCIFDPITGEAYVDIYVELSAGIGPFSISTKIPIADITLARFDIFECPPETPEFSPLYGLAEQITNSMVLNVGGRADLRRLYRDDGTFVQGDDATQPESYRVVLARDPGDDGVLPGESTPGPLVPGSLDVYAFGRVQRYGTLDAPLSLISGAFGELSDTLVIDGAVLVDASVSGGSGGDLLYGGGGNDRFHGDADNDVLSGFAGNDTLIGGSGDDDLIGGTGADSMDGGAGRDKVSYEKANIALGLGVVMAVVNGKMRGFNGDAEGDTIEDVEYIIGTRHGDILLADPSNTFFGFGDEYNTLDGRDGNDVLIGVELKDDFLLGGRGGDNMNGKSGRDGTSYATSFGGVFVDLGAKIFFGGDATGDWLTSIEIVGGSHYSDVLIGNSSDNLLDGASGDDFIGDGGGSGQDTLNGGGGNDTVLGGANGDTLNGGGGRDLASYAYQAAAVYVDLEQGFGFQRFDPFAGVDDLELEIAGYSTFEDLEGGAQADSLVGDRAYNTIWGLSGNDTIRGGAGNDTLIGGSGGDTLDGQDGLDWADYSSSPGAVQITLSSGAAATGADAAGDRTIAVENLKGSVFTDILTGDGMDNIIDPYLSNLFSSDVVAGGLGTDTLRLDYSIEDLGRGLVGGFDLNSTTTGSFSRANSTGIFSLDAASFSSIEKLDVVGTFRDDTVYGGGLDDRIVVGSGNDVVISGAGADVVLAQGGNDFVTYGTASNRVLTPFIPAGPFFLDGGRGIDTLSISLGNAGAVILTGAAPGVEFNGVNYANGAGAAVLNFEILRDVITGSGRDRITQDGRYDNVFQSGEGYDDLRPGWGFDTVNGGGDREGVQLGDTSDFGAVTDPERFFDGGDVLRLDYRDIEEGRWVQSFTRSSYGNQIFQVDGRYVDMFSTSGTYAVYASIRQVTDRVEFSEIEKLDVYGSGSGDILWGAFLSIAADFVPDGVLSTRGDDTLRGEGGDDVIVGWTGDDLILGGAGNDTLSGAGDPFGFQDSQSGSASPDRGELDTLVGGDGADAFVLGNTYDVFHDDDTPFGSSPNRAIIIDFNPDEGDTIVLRSPNPQFGFAGYRTVEAGGSTFIYLADGRGVTGAPDPSRDELIAEVVGFTGFNLGASYVTYAGASQSVLPTTLLRDAPILASLPEAEEQSSSGVNAKNGPEALDPPASNLDPVFTVQQNNVASQIRTALGDLAGDADSDGLADAFNVSLTLSGSGEAFGTFADDPFGLGSGVVLSTGRVVELPGPNLIDGGTAGPNLSVPLNFVKIGRLGNTDIFRAEITGINLDIKSLNLKDADIRTGGGGGVASGFDIDFVAFSSTKLEAFDGSDPVQAAANDVNSASVLNRLDVLDYTNANIYFDPGTQRGPANGFDPGPNLIGTINEIVVAPASLAVRDSNGGFLGGVTLGDGGSLGFDLIAPLDTSGPVYLYVGEFGASGEQLDGSIELANTNVVPLGDLSTDLGATGLGGDTTTLTYRFTPAAGKQSLVFDFVLFTEALKEVAGQFPQDTFKIILNGVDLATLSDGSAAALSNLMIAPNAPAHPDLIHNTPGTGPAADKTRADAYTKPLSFRGPVVAGVENTLVIEVKDLGDAWLDSGILLKSLQLSDDYFGGFGGFGVPNLPTGEAPDVPGMAKILVDGSDAPLTEAGAPGSVTVTVPDEVPIDQPVTVTLTPTDGLDLGNGAGQPIDVVLSPGLREVTLPVAAVNIPGPPLPGKIDLSVSSADTLFDGLLLAPVPFEVVGDPPPVFQGGDTLTVSILENTTPVTTVAATDPDGGPVSFSLAGGDDQALFVIDPATGQLAFASAPDFEAPADSDGDNLYDVVVRATDQAGGFDEQTVTVSVLDVAARSMKVSFVSENTPLRSTMGWYDAATGRGGILFSSIEGAGPARTVKPGDFRTFTSEAAPGSIHFFLVPNGGGIGQNSAQELAKPIQLVQVGSAWAIATVGPDGQVEETPGGQPNLLFGQGASAYFTEAARNPGGLDYASSRSGPAQTPSTLAGDTADGPTGMLAWEDLPPQAGKAGDADYNDGVFLASWLAASAQPAVSPGPSVVKAVETPPQFLTPQIASLQLIGVSALDPHTY